MRRKRSILAIDDDPDIRRVVKRSLGNDYVVRTAADAVDGFGLAAESHPDLIIMDAVMPGLDGFALTSMIRQHARMRLTPVLMLTGLTGLDAEIESKEVGADDYMSKPFDLSALRSRVKELMGGRFK